MDVKRAVISVASAFFASVGFVLSVFAIILNPFLPEPPAKSPPLETQRRYIANSPFIHSKPHSSLQSDSGISSKYESDTPSQTTSCTSLPSSNQSAVGRIPPVRRRPQSCSGTVPLQAQRYAHRYSAPPPQRSPVQRSTLPPMGSVNVLSDAPLHTGIPALAVHEVRASPPASILSSSSSSSSSPASSPPASSPPSLPPAPVPISPPARRPKTAPTHIPLTSTPATASARSPKSDRSPSGLHNSHSFLKRPWTGHRNTPSRSATCPQPSNPPEPPPDRTIPRSSSSPSIKRFCPREKIERRALRKSSSTKSELKSNHGICAKSSHAPEHHTLPRARTQPYEAPYFFPHPGSPEAADYVRKAREDKITSRPFFRHSSHFPLVLFQQRHAEEKPKSSPKSQLTVHYAN